MAEHIGDAEVHVVLEGDGPKSRLAKRRLEREWKKSGEAAGEEYYKGLDETSAKKARVSAAKITDAFRKMKWSDIGDESGTAYGATLTKRMLDSTRKLNATRLAEEKSLNSAMAQTARRAAAEDAKLGAERIRRTKAERKTELSDWDAMFKSIDVLAKDSAKENTRLHAEMTASAKRAAAEEMKLDADRAKRTKAAAKLELTEWQTAFNQINKEAAANERDRIKLQRSSEVSTISSFDRIARAAGRTFGRGSRSNILNFFGGIIEGGVRVLSILPRMAVGFGSMVKTFSQLRSSGGGFFESLSGAFKSGAGGFAAFGTAIASAAVAIPVFVLAAGVLTAALSMLLGIVTALAGSLTFALVGGLVAVAGLLLPVAAGVGVLVAAIASMSDAQKAAVKDAIQPFIAGMKDIGSAAADAIFDGERFTRTISNMTSALTSSNMKELVVSIADAIGDVGDGWAESLNSPGFKRWLTAMSKTVPDQIRDLGRVVGNVVGGIGGFFLAAQPFISSFTGWLERITGEFSRWANSRAGRDEIVAFLDRAKESAKAVGGFLGEVTGLLADLFTAGQSTGDSIFKDMENAVRSFREYIAEGGLEQWFKDAKDFADDLGQALKKVGQFIDAIDNAFTRITASGAVQYLGDIFDLFTSIASLDFGGTVKGALNVITYPFEQLARLLLPDAWVDKAKSFGAGIVKGIVEGLKDLGPAVLDVIDKTPLGFLADKLGFGANDIKDAYTDVTGQTKVVTRGLAQLFEDANDRVKRSFFDARDGAIQSGTFILNSMRSSAEESAWAMGGAAERVKQSFFAITQAGMGSASSVGAGMSNAATGIMSFFNQTGTALSATFSSITAASLGSSSTVTTSMGEAAANTTSFFAGVGGSVSAQFNAMAQASIGSSGTMMGAMGGAASSATSFFAQASSNVQNSFWSMAGAASGSADSIVGSMGRASASMGGLVGSMGSANSLLRQIAASAGAAAGAIGAIPRIPSGGGMRGATGGALLGNGMLATAGRMAGGGGMVRSQRKRNGVTIGESGVELVVPVARPLHMVDPLVRPLSAIAQGMAGLPYDSKPGKSVVVEQGAIQIVGDNPYVAANAVVNEIVDRVV